MDTLNIESFLSTGRYARSTGRLQGPPWWIRHTVIIMFKCDDKLLFLEIMQYGRSSLKLLFVFKIWLGKLRRQAALFINLVFDGKDTVTFLYSFYRCILKNMFAQTRLGK